MKVKVIKSGTTPNQRVQKADCPFIIDVPPDSPRK
jgi:hypothetical protein